MGFGHIFWVDELEQSLQQGPSSLTDPVEAFTFVLEHHKFKGIETIVSESVKYKYKYKYKSVCCGGTVSANFPPGGISRSIF